MPFMVWDLEPQPSFVQIGIITSLGNLFNLIGTVVFGTLHDTMGTRFVSLVATVVTLLYIIIASQVTSHLSINELECRRIATGESTLAYALHSAAAHWQYLSSSG